MFVGSPLFASLSRRQVRRLALARAGLLKTEWTGLPRRAAGNGKRTREALRRIISNFGYLQLDTVSIAGARSHAIVLAARLEGFDAGLAEGLLRPGGDLFEYWGHEACWMPLELYPAFEFRRRDYHRHPWWGDVIAEHSGVARELMARIRAEGPLRSLDMEGRGSRGWWDLKLSKRVAAALWSTGELAIRERRNFQRSYDLATRVIPAGLREAPLEREVAMETLILKALDGHGWATPGTIAATWRLINCKPLLDAALARLHEQGCILPVRLVRPGGAPLGGWIQPVDMELADRLDAIRPRRDKGVLLSPFDPVLWDRQRVSQLFDFDQVLEIFKPAAQRVYGYYCLPVLAGERLVARLDLKADRRNARLRTLSCRHEAATASVRGTAETRQAVATALTRYARATALEIVAD